MDNKLDRKLSSETSGISSLTDNEDLSCALQKMTFTDSLSVDENVNSLDVNLNDDVKGYVKRKYSLDKKQYKEIRRWKRIGKGTNILCVVHILKFYFLE